MLVLLGATANVLAVNVGTCTDLANLRLSSLFKYWLEFATQWVYKIFIALDKILFELHLVHHSFWPSADAKPTCNDLVHSMPW